MFKIPNTKSGFTLIELLVVIGIIGLLATIITMNVQSARQKARCAKRRADIVSLQAPLEAYYDANKAYPSTGNALWGTCPSYGSRDVYGANGWIPNLAPIYIRRLPSEPNPGGSYKCYLYRSDGNNYKILVHMYPPPSELDGCTFNDPKDTLYNPHSPTYSWMVCSGEPACSSW